MLHLTATIRARPGKTADLRRALEALIEPTRAEEGCLTYSLHVGEEHEDLFVFYESWASRDAWERHMEADHLTAFKAQSDELVADWQLALLRKVA